MLQFGGDPDFKRRESRKFICDATYCDEMKCKCKKYAFPTAPTLHHHHLLHQPPPLLLPHPHRRPHRYCRCRGVPVPMFEGETDDNNKGIPLSQTEAGYWPWWPNLYTSYYSNTDPPRK